MAGLLSLLRLDPMFCIYQKIASGAPKTAPAPSPEDPKLPATPGHSGTGPGTKKVKENQRKSDKIKRKSKENQRKSKKITENLRKSKKIKRKSKENQRKSKKIEENQRKSKKIKEKQRQ